MRFLGIDPGTTRIGYGLVEGSKTPKLVSYGVIEVEASSESARLAELSQRLTALLSDTELAAAGVERIFFSKNRKTAISVAQARGVIVSKLTERGIHIVEWHPSAVKLAVTNYGKADKLAVKNMVCRILNVSDLPGHDDATDALAIAIATAFNHSTIKI